jgi:sarcosine oxidase
VIVVGAGIMGLATARALARACRDVLVVEQFDVGHGRGSSHGDARIFRLVYDDPVYVRLAQQALPLWRELEAETDAALLRTTGSVDIGEGLEGRLAALEACEVEFDVVSGEQLAARYPLALDPDAPVLLQPAGGVLHAERALRAFLASATSHGARLLEQTRVEAIDADGRARVSTSAGMLVAEAAVVTAGPWAVRLLEPLGIRLPVMPTRETASYFAPPAGALPTVIDWRPPASDYRLPRPGELVYALPSPQGLKVGVHRSGVLADPDDEGQVDVETIRCASDWVAAHLPGADARSLHAETCFYTNMPDESFVLERHGSLVVGSPCSGHGFKFAPAIGEQLASLVVEALA